MEVSFLVAGFSLEDILVNGVLTRVTGSSMLMRGRGTEVERAGILGLILMASSIWSLLRGMLRLCHQMSLLLMGSTRSSESWTQAACGWVKRW